MPWTLEIRTIDVGQGESALIVARNAAAGQSRTMLIDGGLPGQARTVHNHLVARGVAALDHILVSHYDGDHSGGVMSLLTADNVDRMSAVIASAAGEAAFDAAMNAPNNDYKHQLAAAAAAATATALGGYGNHSGVADDAGQATWALALPVGAPDAHTARDADLVGSATINGAAAVNATLIHGTPKRRSTSRAAGIAAAGVAGSAAARAAAARAAVFAQLRTTVPPHSRFATNGCYRNTHIIDIGNTPHMPPSYQGLIQGSFLMSNNHVVRPPGTNRTRTSLTPANFTNELLWNSGPAAMVAPANAPAIFLVACLKHIWQAPAHAVPIASGQPDNDDSIGVVLRFNDFFFYTGGDLPSQGEDLVATAVMGHGLPNPHAAGNYNTPGRIAAIKCGHHGSSHSTSLAFLNQALPRAAVISSGDNAFGAGGEDHPAQTVVNNLHGHAQMRFFFMTNCRYQRVHVPASQSPPTNQMVAGNKSRISGDNAANNLAAGRDRGDIRISMTEARSQAAAGPGRFLRVRYFESDAGVQALRNDDIQF